MATVEMVMPKMGESIMEGTILKWLKEVGDPIEQDESVLEVATDKVDTEVPATHAGVLKEILVEEGGVVAVGKPIAIITTAAEVEIIVDPGTPVTHVESRQEQNSGSSSPTNGNVIVLEKPVAGRFYSPLVLNIARAENIQMAELETIPGSGKEGRVTKKDIKNYIGNRNGAPTVVAEPHKPATPILQEVVHVEKPVSVTPAVPVNEGDEIIEMDRMRKMIADRMVESKRIAPHVTSFVEADVTNMVMWRNKVKKEFLAKEHEKLTFTPIMIQAVVKAIKDYPMINVSVDGDKIIKRGSINIGMAVALPSGNLIVPVIKNADQLNIVGLTKKVNELAKKARENKLTPDDLTGGTFTVSNVGSFGNVMGTPIIMQPQVAIMALGAIKKKPAVIETPAGDAIGIRHFMYLSHSYDHRVVDGSLGGMVVRRVADYLEQFDVDQDI